MEGIFSLRKWLKEVKTIGKLKEVAGADVKYEIGAITEVNASSGQGNVLHFHSIPGYRPEFGVVSGALLTPKTMALALNMKGSEDKVENADELAEKIRIAEEQASNYKIKYVEDGPIMENIQVGDQVDLSIFPTPIWHENDGGPYIGTGGVQIHEDPDTGVLNVGCYRMHLLDKNHIGNYIVKSNQGNVIREKYWAQGKPCPVVAIFGMHPAFFLAGATTFEMDVNELEVVGAMLGEQVPVIKGKITGLPIPADAEIAVEGWVYPDKKMLEGEFAEFTGYYGGGVSKQPYIDVKAVYYRNGANILGAAPSIPPHDFSFMSSSVRAAILKEQLRKAGIRGVRGCWPLEVGGSRVILVTSLKQLYPGHANQALLVSGGCNAGSLMTRYCIVVDDDIDPSDVNQVLWALAFRCNPVEDIDVVRNTFSLTLDPLISDEDKKNGKTVTSRALINACIPYNRLKTFSKIAACSPELVKKTKEKWGFLWE